MASRRQRVGQLAERVREIAAWTSETGVTSLYLDVEGPGRRRRSDRERSFAILAHEARERAEELGPATARSVSTDLSRIAGWLDAHREQSDMRGLAFFSRSADEDLQVLVLPRAVRDQITIDHRADLRQLEAILNGVS